MIPIIVIIRYMYFITNYKLYFCLYYVNVAKIEVIKKLKTLNKIKNHPSFDYFCDFRLRVNRKMTSCKLRVKLRVDF